MNYKEEFVVVKFVIPVKTIASLSSNSVSIETGLVATDGVVDVVVVTIADVTDYVALTDSVEPLPAQFWRKYSSRLHLLGVHPDINLLDLDVLNHAIQFCPQQ